MSPPQLEDRRKEFSERIAIGPAAGNFVGLDRRPDETATENATNSYWLYEADIPDPLTTIIDAMSAFPQEVAASESNLLLGLSKSVVGFVPNHIVSWIIQPTDQTACLLHMEVMIRESAKSVTPDSEQKDLAYWLERTRQAAVVAEKTQTDLLSCVPPEADRGAHTALTEMPVENNYLAYCAQKYLIDRLLLSTRIIGTTPIPIPNSP